MKYWIVSAPNEQESAFQRMKNKLERDQGACSAYPFRLPQFRVGTYDSLMAISDILGKHDQAVEQTVDRLLRNYRDLTNKPEIVPMIEFVELNKYLQNFEWDEAKFSSADSLEEIESAIMALVSRTEDDLKIRLGDYTTTKQAVTAIERRSQGNLMTKSLVGIVKEGDYVESEHMQSLYVVLPKYSEDEFMKCYEDLAPLVIPRSAAVISTDNDYALISITIFKKSIEEFKAACREKRYTVRDFKFKNDDIKASEEEYARLRTELDDQHVTLVKWLETNFGEGVIALMHLKAIRAFVESVLRYGLPVNFEVALLKPQNKNESRLRNSLQDLFGHLGGEWTKPDDGNVDGATVPGLVQEDFYPYVFNELAITA
eukprot:Plantae.Rhodophyta-Purpureofilum_apyrenoidigerum.ctg6960.p1 GENE.Plantae.Rhodophyta-Purpureofilum_apyrenoidigerum.ctg6960~~Plantae.Rhodophyta-Purpureofilum_apyrenoidigerum.ctg6960.p1  ORF type:complete len:393 (+),score=91.61 Plantae.Rhodophyta-Purpureofilum_apyrenoidigerum.ctg6960:64-1179(+)